VNLQDRLADLADTAIELPVVTSFTRIGHDVRRRLDDWSAVDDDLHGRVVVLTGATSGLGLETAEQLAALGATLVLVGRDEQRTTAVRDRLAAGFGDDRFQVGLADMGDLDAVERLATELHQRFDRIDVLVHNAGALTAERHESPQGIEMTVAAQVVGPFLLTARLLPLLRAGAPGRVLAMSSGGMYTAPLAVDRLQMSDADYGGSEQYARAKRAQVTLQEMWAERVDPAEVVFHSLHPGWADTPGVASSLPTFHRVMGPLLRSPEQGADTLVWLAADDTATDSSGGFWLDRRERSTHKLPSTRRSDTPERRRRLWDSVVELARLAPADLPPPR
jgi:NAD(P)-dependent dehydrogenase (short-subunit alcohol dehydrogenase family)